MSLLGASDSFGESEIFHFGEAVSSWFYRIFVSSKSSLNPIAFRQKKLPFLIEDIELAVEFE